MAVAYGSNANLFATATSLAQLAPLCPATVNSGDVLILHISMDGTSDAPSPPGDWTLLYGPITTTTASPSARHWIYGKIADGTEDGATINCGTAGGTNLRVAQIGRFTGVTSGTISQVVHNFTNVDNATDPAGPDAQTSVAGGLAVFVYQQNDDNAVAQDITGESGGSWTYRYGGTSSTGGGVDKALAHYTGTPTADPGTISGGTVSTANDPVNSIGFGIEPSPAAITNNDSPTGRVILSGSVSESSSITRSSSPSGVVVVSGSRAENRIYSDVCSGTVVVTRITEPPDLEWQIRAGTRYPQAVLADSPAVYFRADDLHSFGVDTTTFLNWPTLDPDPDAIYLNQGGWDASGNGRNAVVSLVGEAIMEPVASLLTNDPSTAGAKNGDAGGFIPSNAGKSFVDRGSSYWAYGDTDDLYQPLTGTQVVTFEWWVRRHAGQPPDDTADDYADAGLLGELTGGVCRVRLPFDVGTGEAVDDLIFQVSAGTATWEDCGIGTGSIHHVVLRFNPSAAPVGELAADTAELFIDGVSKGTRAQTGNYLAIGGLVFGALSDAWSGWFGELDEVAMYLDVLSAARIRAHYEAGSYTYNDTPTPGVVVLSGTTSESYTSAGTTFNDSPTGQVVLSGSRVEGKVATETRSGSVLLGGSTLESKSATDTRSGVVVLAGTRTESHYRNVAVFGQVVVTGSVSQQKVYNDSRSGTIVLTGAATESRSAADTRSGTVVISGTRVESFIGPTVYTDTSSGSVIVSGSVVRSSSRVSTPSGIVVLAGTRVESWTKAGIANDFPTGTVVITGSLERSEIRTEARSGLVVLTGSVSESHAVSFTDTRSGTIVVTGSVTRSSSRSESRSGVVLITGSCIESYNVAGAYFDSPTGAIIVSGTRTESFAGSHSDSPTGVIVVSGTAQRSESRTEARTGQIVITGSVSESWTKGYSDTATGSIIISGSAAEELRFVETPFGSIYLTGSATESTDYVAGLLGQIIVTGSASEQYVPSGAAFHYPFGEIVISGSVEEIHNRWDWVDGERWPGSSDARWGEDVGERWEVDQIV